MEHSENKAYLHIGNGGVSFEVNNDCGPTIVVKATHFGNTTQGMSVHTNVESLRTIGEMFLRASDQEFSKEYCYAATIEPEAGLCAPEGDEEGSIRAIDEHERDGTTSESPTIYEKVILRGQEYELHHVPVCVPIGQEIDESKLGGRAIMVVDGYRLIKLCKLPEYGEVKIVTHAGKVTFVEKVTKEKV